MARQDVLERYHGRQVWLPDVSRLLPGDILLTTNRLGDQRKELKQSRVIRAMTLSRFSHALICSTPPALVEAIGPGVSTLSLARCFAHNIRDVRVLRYPDPAVAREAATCVQQEVGRSYSFDRAVRSIFPAGMLAEIEDSGIFCSALVAQAFANARAAPFTTKPANHTTPADIARMPCLINVTAAIFGPTLAPNNINTLSALDGDRVPTLSAEQTGLSAKCARLVHPLAADLAEAFPEAELDIIPTIFGLTEFVVRAVEAIGLIAPARLDNYVDRIVKIDHQIAAFINAGEYHDLLRRIAAADDEMMRAVLQVTAASQPNFDSIRNLLATGIRAVNERRDAIAYWRGRGGHSKAIAAYLRVETKVTQALAVRNGLLAEALKRAPR